MKGQMSAEMLILIVVVLAVVAILAMQIINQAKQSSKSIEDSSNKIRLIAEKCQDKQCKSDEMYDIDGSGNCICKSKN